MSVHVDKVGAGHRKILKTLSDGGKLWADRVYPRDRQYWLIEKALDVPTRIMEGTVANLLDRGWITFGTHDPLGDYCEYKMTPAGREIMQSGRIVWDDEQPNLFANP